MATILELKQLQIPVKANFILLSYNIDEAEETINWFNDLGINFLTDTMIFPSNENIIPMRATVKQYVNYLKKYSLAVLMRTLCTAFYAKLRIDPLGYVLPCDFLDIKLANIYATDFGHDFSNAFSVLMINNFSYFLEKQKCNDCELKNTCVYCPAYKYLKNGEEFLCAWNLIVNSFYKKEQK